MSNKEDLQVEIRAGTYGEFVALANEIDKENPIFEVQGDTPPTELYEVFIAEVSGKPVGFILDLMGGRKDFVGKRVVDTPLVSFVDIGILPSFRRQGIATKLYNASAKPATVTRLWACKKDNRISTGLALSLGGKVLDWNSFWEPGTSCPVSMQHYSYLYNWYLMPKGGG